MHISSNVPSPTFSTFHRLWITYEWTMPHWYNSHADSTSTKQLFNILPLPPPPPPFGMTCSEFLLTAGSSLSTCIHGDTLATTRLDQSVTQKKKSAALSHHEKEQENKQVNHDPPKWRQDTDRQDQIGVVHNYNVELSSSTSFSYLHWARLGRS